MSLVINVLIFVLTLFLMLLFARFVIMMVASIVRDWRPTGAGLVAVESVLTITDPPIKLVRRLVPPLNIGGLRLDLAIMIVMLGTMMLRWYLGLLA